MHNSVFEVLLEVGGGDLSRSSSTVCQHVGGGEEGRLLDSFPLPPPPPPPALCDVIHNAARHRAPSVMARLSSFILVAD